MTALEFKSEHKNQTEDRSLRVRVATERKLEAQEPLGGEGLHDTKRIRPFIGDWWAGQTGGTVGTS